jgi:hypothetical protein
MDRITNTERWNRRVQSLKVEDELVINSATECCNDGTCESEKNEANKE